MTYILRLLLGFIAYTILQGFSIQLQEGETILDRNIKCGEYLSKENLSPVSINTMLRQYMIEKTYPFFNTITSTINTEIKDGKHTRENDIYEIEYLGDDSDYPILISTIVELQKYNTAREILDRKTLAYIVRSPLPQNIKAENLRPRHRGEYAFDLFISLCTASPSALVKDIIVKDIPFEEHQIILDQCPNAKKHLKRIKKSRFSNFDDDFFPLHADSISISIQNYNRKSSYTGWIEKGTVSAETKMLIDELIDCTETQKSITAKK